VGGVSFCGCEPYASLVKTMKQRHMVHGINRATLGFYLFSQVSFEGFCGPN